MPAKPHCSMCGAGVLPEDEIVVVPAKPGVPVTSWLALQRERGINPEVVAHLACVSSRTSRAPA
jgi:hypothetical protein